MISQELQARLDRLKTRILENKDKIKDGIIYEKIGDEYVYLGEQYAGQDYVLFDLDSKSFYCTQIDPNRSRQWWMIRDVIKQSLTQKDLLNFPIDDEKNITTPIEERIEALENKLDEIINNIQKDFFVKKAENGICIAEDIGGRDSQQDSIFAGYCNKEIASKSTEFFHTTINNIAKSNKDQRYGGTTLCSTIIKKRNENIVEITVANLGDSRAVLLLEKDGMINSQCLTEDHEPNLLRIKGQIESDPNLSVNNSRIVNKNNKGALACGATIGDKEFNTVKTPDIDSFIIDKNEVKNAYLILACDGLYERGVNMVQVMTSYDESGKYQMKPSVNISANRNLLRHFPKQLEEEIDLKKLISNTKEEGARDNISVALIPLIIKQEIQINEPVIAAVCDGHGERRESIVERRVMVNNKHEFQKALYQSKEDAISDINTRNNYHEFDENQHADGAEIANNAAAALFCAANVREIEGLEIGSERSQLKRKIRFLKEKERPDIVADLDNETSIEINNLQVSRSSSPSTHISSIHLTAEEQAENKINSYINSTDSINLNDPIIEEYKNSLKTQARNPKPNCAYQGAGIRANVVEEGRFRGALSIIEVANKDIPRFKQNKENNFTDCLIDESCNNNLEGKFITHICREGGKWQEVSKMSLEDIAQAFHEAEKLSFFVQSEQKNQEGKDVIVCNYYQYNASSKTVFVAKNCLKEKVQNAFRGNSTIMQYNPNDHGIEALANYQKIIAKEKERQTVGNAGRLSPISVVKE